MKWSQIIMAGRNFVSGCGHSWDPGNNPWEDRFSCPLMRRMGFWFIA